MYRAFGVVYRGNGFGVQLSLILNGRRLNVSLKVYIESYCPFGHKWIIVIGKPGQGGRVKDNGHHVAPRWFSETRSKPELLEKPEPRTREVNPGKRGNCLR